ncbi:MAG: hypothetical protein ABI177_13715 [Edaphobacter sp.]
MEKTAKFFLSGHWSVVRSNYIQKVSTTSVTAMGKQAFRPVGKDAEVAVVARLSKEHLLRAAALGAHVVADSVGDRPTLAKAKKRFLADKAAHQQIRPVKSSRMFFRSLLG